MGCGTDRPFFPELSMPRLIAESGRIIGQDYEVSDDIVLGRKRTCGVVIDDAKSSREHTRVYKEGGSYYVQDLGSSNGTFLNEVRIDKSPLVFGDRIRIGETVLAFVGDPEQNLEGQTVGGFQILEKLGHRDIGIVYKARQVALDRIVALKVLDRDLSNDKEFVGRFIEEARAAGTLRHPNIIHVFDVGKSNDQYYICMEYVSGKTLRDTLADDVLTLDDKVRIARECTSALAFAHDKGIVHKDITPTNIILTQEKVAKIADMGIAKIAETAITSRDINSLYYISPEEALGKPVGRQADIYSLGVCLYQTLTGELPFKSDNARDIIKEHITTPVPSPRELVPEVPESLAAICLRMTVIDEAARYSSMQEVLKDLEKVSLSHARSQSKRPARPARPRAPLAVASKPVYVDDDRETEPQPKRRVKIKRASLTSGFLGFVLFVAFLIILFFITSFVTQLLLEQFSRPTVEDVKQLIQESEKGQ
jgi:serine/threonine protein kinase